MEYQSFYEQNMLSAPSILNCGFEEAPTATLPHRLFEITPNHWRACMRDAIVTSLTNLQKLQNILVEANTATKWKFYNVVICKTSDKISKLSQKCLIKKIRLLNQTWAVAEFKTFFISIDMNDLQIQEVLSLCSAGGIKSQYYPSCMSDFKEQFKQIANEMSIVPKKKNQVSIAASSESSPYQISQAGFSRAVSLVIQASQSMQNDGIWDRIINTICFYMKNLDKKDLISGIVYNQRQFLVAKGQFIQNKEEIVHRQAEVISHVNILQYRHKINAISLLEMSAINSQSTQAINMSDIEIQQDSNAVKAQNVPSALSSYSYLWQLR